MKNNSKVPLYFLAVSKLRRWYVAVVQDIYDVARRVVSDQLFELSAQSQSVCETARFL
jgi:hypothetical protein